MGGEVMLLMDRGQYKKAKAFIKANFEKAEGGEYISIAPKTGDYTPGDCWIEFRGRGRIDVGYAMGEFNSTWADAIACGIRDHFRVKKGGWDSVGYCDDFMFTKPWNVKIKMTKKAIQRNPKAAKIQGIFGKTMKDDIKEYRNFQRLYEVEVGRIFKGIPKIKYNLTPPPKEKPPKLKKFKITWKKGKGQKGKKTVTIYTAEAKELEEGRFILFPEMPAIDMWGLLDTKTQSQHYMMRMNAEIRIFEILHKEKETEK